MTGHLTSRRRVAYAAWICAAGLAIAACGDDESSDDASGDAQNTAEATDVATTPPPETSDAGDSSEETAIVTTEPATSGDDNGIGDRRGFRRHAFGRRVRERTTRPPPN